MAKLLRLIFLLLVVAAPLAAAPPAHAGSIRVSAGQAAGMINAYRREHGLPGLAVDPALTRAAAMHSTDMARHNRLAHSVSHGSVYSRVIAAGGRPGLVAENVSGGRRTVSAVIRGWIASPGHKRNLLLPGARRMGIAAVYSPDTRYKFYWTLILAGGE